MFVQRGNDGSIVGVFERQQEFAQEELPANHPDLVAFQGASVPNWDALLDDLDGSNLLARITEDAVQHPQLSLPVQLLITLLTSTRKLENLQQRLNLVVVVLVSLNKGLTPGETTWLNDHLQAHNFDARIGVPP